MPIAKIGSPIMKATILMSVKNHVPFLHINNPIKRSFTIATSMQYHPIFQSAKVTLSPKNRRAAVTVRTVLKIVQASRWKNLPKIKRNVLKL
jgi:hypothetical protein